MEVQIKKTVKAGNSSAVILPRSWLNKEVRVELVKKTNEKILEESLEIAKKHINLSHVLGIYLVGSYARREETKDSDIDILIISKNTDKEMIQEGIYNILIVSEDLLQQKLKSDLLPIGQMLKEAKPLINSSYLDSINLKVTKKNTKWYIKTTREKLDLVKKVLEDSGNKIDNNVIYTLVLRIRTLYIIQKLIKNEKYSKKSLIKLIKKVSGSERAYEAYSTVKSDLEKKDLTRKENAWKLHGYLEKQLKKTKKMVGY